MSDLETKHENGPGERFLLTYFCDRCHIAVIIENDREKAKAFYDWAATHGGRELCLTCQAEWGARFVSIPC